MRDTNKALLGNDLQLWLASKPIAAATNCSIQLSRDTIDMANKDSGQWSKIGLGRIGVTISSENLFTDEAYSELFDAFINGTTLTVKFGTINDEDINFYTGIEDDKNWEADNDIQLNGYGFITSLDLNAPDADNATFSVEIQMTGELTNE